MEELKNWWKKYLNPDTWILCFAFCGNIILLISSPNVMGDGVPDLMVAIEVIFLCIFANSFFAHHFKKTKGWLLLFLMGILFFGWSFFRIAKYQYGLI